MKHQTQPAVPRVLVTAIAAALIAAAGSVWAVPTYTVNKVVQTVKPHESDTVGNVWVASNEGNVEESAAGNGGITIFSVNNKVISTLSVECGVANIPVINLDGSVWGNAPCGAEDHPRHPHGLDINSKTQRVYQVLEHSGLKWNADRTMIEPTADADEESGLLVEINISNPKNPTIVRGWLLGHAAEESAVNENNGKVYVGNHEPSPGVSPASWVSVIKPNASNPYVFIDLPEGDDIQGIAVDEPLNRVFGTTHVGQKMYAFNSATDVTAYTVDIRGPFDTQVGGVEAGDVLHMHDLAVDTKTHRVYQTIHTLAPADAVEAPEGTVVVDEDTETQGHWVAEVNTNNGNAVTIIDVPGVHAHFVDVDSGLKSVLVSGEHTGNLGVVDATSRTLKQVIQITPPDPTPPAPGEEATEPEVHGVNINQQNHNAYISDETDWNQTVTILKP